MAGVVAPTYAMSLRRAPFTLDYGRLMGVGFVECAGMSGFGRSRRHLESDSGPAFARTTLSRRSLIEKQSLVELPYAATRAVRVLAAIRIHDAC
jgi:hypothetical protein